MVFLAFVFAGVGFTKIFYWNFSMLWMLMIMKL